MSNLEGFDARTVEPNVGFPVLPAGDYDVAIVGADKKPTKEGDGAYLNMDLQILNGEHQNKHLFEKLNLWNKNDKAVQIAKGALSAICRAVNVLTPKDSAELVGKTLRVKVGIKKGDDEYGDQNKITKYSARDGSATQVAAPAGVPTGTAAGRPW